jgi:hypothetical protein
MAVRTLYVWITALMIAFFYDLSYNRLPQFFSYLHSFNHAVQAEWF